VGADPQNQSYRQGTSKEVSDNLNWWRNAGCPCSVDEVDPHDIARIEAPHDLARTIEQTQGATDFFREVDVLVWARNMPSKKDLDLIDILPSLINNVSGWFDEISDPAHNPAANLKEIQETVNWWNRVNPANPPLPSVYEKLLVRHQHLADLIKWCNPSGGQHAMNSGQMT
jgi:hypothetical protein